MLYGMNVNAFVTDFPEAPVGEGIRRWEKVQRVREGLDASTLIPGGKGGVGDETGIGVGVGDTTGMSTASGNVSMKATPRRKSMAPQGQPMTPGTTSTIASGVGAGLTGRGQSGIPSRGGARGGIGSGSRGTRGGSRGSGLPRGRGTGRGVR
jgi:hypothetical protein